MFKKPFKLQSQNNLKSSEKKKLKDSLLKAYPHVTSEEFDSVLGGSKDNLALGKISGTYTLIYLLQGQPLFFDLDGRGDFYPTGIGCFHCNYTSGVFLLWLTNLFLFLSVYTLWKIPHLLPTLTVHPHVFKYISGGAGNSLLILILIVICKQRNNSIV